jgi:hypothetical protein
MDEFGKWKPSNVQPHARLKLQVKVSESPTAQLNLPTVQNTTSTSVSALADTAAQMCVADWQVAKKMGLKKNNILLTVLTVSVADNLSLESIGSHFITIFSTSGQVSEQLVYFAIGIGEIYLSKAALIDLQVINEYFPKVGSCRTNQSNHDTSQHDEHRQHRHEIGAIYEVQDGVMSVHREVHSDQTPE